MPTPFDLLNAPLTFPIDQKALDRAWMRKAATLHPDHSTDPEDAARLAKINRARTTLSNPELAANALLEALGGPSASQDKALPDGFLMEMLEVRDRLEEVKADDDPKARQELDQWAKAQREGYIDRLCEAFAACTKQDANTATLAEIRRELNAWRYIERLIEQLDPGFDHADADF